MTHYKTITGKEANDLKLVPITRAYEEREYEMLDRAVAELKDKPHSLVQTSEGIVIARPARDVNTIKTDHSKL